MTNNRQFKEKEVKNGVLGLFGLCSLVIGLFIIVSALKSVFPVVNDEVYTACYINGAIIGGLLSGVVFAVMSGFFKFKRQMIFLLIVNLLTIITVINSHNSSNVDLDEVVKYLIFTTISSLAFACISTILVHMLAGVIANKATSSPSKPPAQPKKKHNTCSQKRRHPEHRSPISYVLVETRVPKKVYRRKRTVRVYPVYR